jgi:hypothetical protein
VAVSSYLPETAGGTVVGAGFPDEASAGAALELLASSGVRWQDISVIARDAAVAERVAGQRAWTPQRSAKGLARLLRGRLPSELRRRFSNDLRAGRIVLIVAADGQPADTIAALLVQAKGEHLADWWQSPAALFAPPELAGPF